MGVTGASAREIRRSLGWALVGALTIASLTAAWALLSGSFDDTDWRVIATSLGFALCSATGASGGTLRLRADERKQLLGGATVALSALTFVLLLAGLWVDDGSDGLWRAFGVAALATLASSHACVMTGARRPGDSDAVSLLTTISIGLGTVDTSLGALAILEAIEPDEGYAEFVGVLVIGLLLSTALAPLLRKLQPTTTAATTPAATPTPATTARGSTPPTAPGGALAEEVMTIATRIEELNADPGIRASEIQRECARLRELARAHSR